MAIGTLRLTRSPDGSVRNEADKVGDDFDSMTPAEKEIRAETINLILGLFKRGGDFTCTKVRSRRTNVTTPEGFYDVSGYVTMLKFVNLPANAPEEIVQSTTTSTQTSTTGLSSPAGWSG